jgi:hypothetical protein
VEGDNNLEQLRPWPLQVHPQHRIHKGVKETRC